MAKFVKGSYRTISEVHTVLEDFRNKQPHKVGSYNKIHPILA